MFPCLQSLNLFSDLMTVLERNVDELSGGELQRFACAVVCIQKADMWAKLLSVDPSFNLSMEMQGLLLGMMQCIRVSDIFRGNFTSRAEEPLGTYSYRLNSTPLIGPPHWLARKVFFLLISWMEFKYFCNWFSKNKCPGALRLLKKTFPWKYRLPDIKTSWLAAYGSPRMVLIRKWRLQLCNQLSLSVCIF